MATFESTKVKTSYELLNETSLNVLNFPLERGNNTGRTRSDKLTVRR